MTREKRRLRALLGIGGGILIVLSLTAITLALIRRASQAKTAESAEAAVRVRVAPAAPAPIAEIVRLPVTLNPAREALLSFKAGGRISRVLVELGSPVRAGAVLASLDGIDLENQVRAARAALAVAEANYANLKAGSRPEAVAIIRAQLRQAEAGLAAQKANYERIRSLYEEQLVSQQQYEAAHSAYQAAMAQVEAAREKLALAEAGPSADALRMAAAQVEQARVAKEIAESQLQNLHITAPFDGVVTMVKARIGETASPGMPLIGLADLSGFYATGYAGQDLAVDLREGQKAEIAIRMDAETLTLPGRVIAVGRTVDQTLRAYEVKILCEHDRPELKGGMLGEAVIEIKVGRTDRPVIPREAVVVESARSYVYVVRDNRAERREVKIGAEDGDRVEIASGLDPGELVVVAGQYRLSDGAPVEVE